MSNESVSPLQQLPVEILYRIFDDLDVFTLFFSLGQTCHRLRTLVHSYDRLTVDFTLLSKPQFQSLLHVIDSHHVTSLTLAHQPETVDAVSIFCSHFRRRPFDRLQSLVLHRVLENQLSSILKCVQSTFLTSWTLKTLSSDYFGERNTSDAISSMITNSRLCRLEIGTIGGRMKQIQWSTTNPIKQLKIDARLRINELRPLLEQLPHLQILSVKWIEKDLINNQMKVEGSTEKFRQLTSFSVHGFDGSIDDLEHLLALTSSLTHLKLVQKGAYGDGKRWEHFIQLNLPHLTKFEFFFTINLPNPYSPADVESIVSSFQSPFWLEQKKWIVRNEISYNMWNHPCLELYSLPICIDTYICGIPCNTHYICSALSEDPSWTDNVTTLEWRFKEPAQKSMYERIQHRPSYRMVFRRVKTLILYVHAKRTEDWLEELPLLVDLQMISKVNVDGFFCLDPKEINVDDVAQYLHLMPNLQSLDISLSRAGASVLPTSTYCAMVPPTVRHLKILTENPMNCVPILERFHQLWSFKCRLSKTLSSSQFEDFENWLMENRHGYSFEQNHDEFSIWFGKSNTVPKSKRRKYNH